jgi:hypothetical protein
LTAVGRKEPIARIVARSATGELWARQASAAAKAAAQPIAGAPRTSISEMARATSSHWS